MEGQGAAADASLAAVDRVASEMKRGRASFQCVQVDPSVACSIIVCQLLHMLDMLRIILTYK